MPAPESKAKSGRFDPYKNFKFRVKWEGKYVAGVSEVSGVTRTKPDVPHRSGEPSIPRSAPGQRKFEAITLERGLTHDTDFEAWANQAWTYPESHEDISAGANQAGSAKDFRKDIVLEVFNEAGQLETSYKVYRCWVSEYQAMPDLDANSNAVAIRLIKLENEGWESETKA